MIRRIDGLNLNPNVYKNTNVKANNTNLDFEKILKESIDEVNQLQQNSDQATIDFAAGKITDVSQVTIAAEKASLSLKLTQEVTNKIIDAYKEITRMQL
ncbi:MAG TPA: flagellar hook-basal body complex protein FliE [Tepiditoga sp.]|nr:flagellar hook-basal body complex protein FliE [Tepiditoga sp.]